MMKLAEVFLAAWLLRQTLSELRLLVFHELVDYVFPNPPEDANDVQCKSSAYLQNNQHFFTSPSPSPSTLKSSQEARSTPLGRLALTNRFSTPSIVATGLTTSISAL